MQRPVVLRRRSPRLAVTSGLLSALIAIGGCGSSGGGGGGTDGDDTGGGVARAATWAKSYGGPAREQATAAAALADGGYIFGGLFNNRGLGGGRIFGFQGGGTDGDAWIVALDSLGDIRWQHSYGLRAASLPDSETTYLAVRPALDGAGTWLAGRVVAANSPQSVYTERAFDLLITRLDGADQVRFSNAYDSGPFPFFPYFFSDEQQTSEGSDSLGTDLWPTSDGGAVVATSVEAFVLADGRGEVARAVWVLKVNAAGEREWSTFVGADEFVGFNGSLGYGFAHSHYRGDGPHTVQIRAEPGGGAILTYGIDTRDAGEESAIRTGRMDVVRLDPGNQSIRWRVRFGDDDVPDDLLVVDADRNGVLDGVLVGGRTDVDDSFSGPKQGVVRLLDGPDGNQLWRRDMGDRVTGLAEACGPSSCEYAALVSVAGDVDRSFMRTLDIGSGSALAERQFPDEAAVHIRSLPGLARFQVLTNPGSGELRLRAIDAAPALPIISETSFAKPQVTLVADAGNGYLGLAGESQDTRRLLRLNASGVGTLSAPISDPDDPRIESAYAIHAIRNAAGTQDIGFLAAAEMLSDKDPVQRAVLLLRLDLDGAIVWQKRLEGFSFNYPQLDPRAFAGPVDLLAPAPDGGFFLGGYALGWGRVVKIDANGAIQWNSLPLSPDAGWQLRAIRTTPDGGVLVAGGQLDEDLARSWVARLDSNGAVQWQNRFEGEFSDPGFFATDLRVTADGGALLAGVTRFGTIAALRIDADGTLRRARQYITLAATDANSNVRVATTANGWALATAVQRLASRDAAGIPAATGRNNVLTLEIAGDNAERPGSVRWGRLHGGLQDEVVHGLEALADGGLLISAQSDSMGDYTEAWMLRVGADGRIADGCNADLGESILTTTDIALARTAYTPDGTPAELQPAPLTAVTTNVIVEQPADIVVARQCSGTANNNPPNANAPRLTVRQAGSLTGVVTSVPSGIVCGTLGGGTCSGEFARNSLVTLRVDSGSVDEFSAWGSGCETISGLSGDTCAVRLDGDKTIDVFFGEGAPPPPPPHTLNVLLAGTGTGSVISSPSGIDCGSDCSELFTTSDQVVTLSADGEFASWNGCDSVDANRCTVTMNRSRTVTATFVADAPSLFLLTVQKNGEGSGVVLSSPGGIECGFACIATFQAGAVVTLTANAVGGSQAMGFTGCDQVIGGSQCTVTMNQSRTVSASFAAAQPPGNFTLTVNVVGNGEVLGHEGDDLPPSLLCVGDDNPATPPVICSRSYPANSLKTMRPISFNTQLPPGAQHAAWQGCSSVAANGDCRVLMDADKTLTATMQ